MSEQMPQFNEVKETVYSNGAKHVYGVDDEGKQRHISHDSVLEAHGYELENQPLDGVYPHEQVMDSTSNDVSTEADNPHRTLEDAQEAFKSTRNAPNYTAVKQAEQAVADEKKQTKHDAFDWERRMKVHMSGKEILDKLQDPNYNISEDEVNTLDLYDQQKADEEKRGLGPITEDDERYWEMTGEEEDTPTEQGVDAINPIEGDDEFEGLNAAQLMDEFVFAKITGNKEDLKKIESHLDKVLLEDTKDMNSTDRNKYVAKLLQEKNRLEIQYLSNLDNTEMSDEQRAHAEVYKQELAKQQLMKLEGLTLEQAILHGSGELSGNDLEAADRGIVKKFNKLLDDHAIMMGLSEQEKEALKQSISEKVLAGLEGDDTPDPEVKKTFGQKLKDKWTRFSMSAAGITKIPSKINKYVDSKLEENTDWSPRKRKLAKLAGAGAITLLAAGGAVVAYKHLNGEDGGLGDALSGDEGGGEDAVSGTAGEDVVGGSESGSNGSDPAARTESTPTDQIENGASTFNIEDGNGYTQEIEDGFPGHSPAEYEAAHEAAIEEFGSDYLQGVDKYQTASGEQRLASSGKGSWAPGVEEFLKNRLG